MVRPIPVALLLALLPPIALAGGQPDPSTVVGPVECAECHKAQTKIWEATHHFSTFADMPRSEEARKIANAMGIRRIKAESLCLDCHFLQVIDDDGEPDPVAGIGCESCHGGAKGWLDRHSKFSGHETKEQESAEERTQRWADSEAAGMIRPSNIYELAKNCTSCHLVPEEKLVNVGGHPPGSDFELVAWSQGEIRHNTWASGDKVNEVPSQERLRVLFVTGAIVELEQSLRATAIGTEKAQYAVAMARRADAARKKMQQIADALSVDELTAIADAGMSAGLKLNNGEQLLGLADEISTQAKAFLASHDGSGLDAIDPMLPAASDYKGAPAEVPGVETRGAS